VTAARAVFVDRDGTIDELVPDLASGRPESPLRLEDVKLIPGSAAALRRLRAAGWLLVGISNQPAAAKGTISLEQLNAVHARVLELLAREEVHFDDFRLCLHHPAGVVPELTGACRCRKPAPGLLLDAARKLGVDLGSSWMIGDTDDDVLAGHAAGCRTVLISHQPSAHKRSGAVSPEATTADLETAAELILRLDGVD
jgi:D-glycero-D-manno-heptose 1,7-bisphosphate phosphatase